MQLRDLGVGVALGIAAGFLMDGAAASTGTGIAVAAMVWACVQLLCHRHARPEPRPEPTDRHDVIPFTGPRRPA